MSFHIRNITAADLDSLYPLLLDLVRFEGIEDRFELTPQRMQDSFFGPNADWHALVASTDNNEIIGFCFYTIANINRAYNTTSCFHIDDLYIKPEYRKKGMGEALLKALAQEATLKNINRIELWCIKENHIGQSFYRKLNGTKVDIIDVIQLEVPSLL